eukprot:1670229-Alexandrium_andersonii.AAC.1
MALESCAAEDPVSAPRTRPDASAEDGTSKLAEGNCNLLCAFTKHTNWKLIGPRGAAVTQRGKILHSMA